MPKTKVFSIRGFEGVHTLEVKQKTGDAMLKTLFDDKAPKSGSIRGIHFSKAMARVMQAVDIATADLQKEYAETGVQGPLPREFPVIVKLTELANMAAHAGDIGVITWTDKWFSVGKTLTPE